MTSNRSPIIVVGPLSPPVNGLTVITERFISQVISDKVRIIYNVSAGRKNNRLMNHLKKAIKYIDASFGIIVNKNCSSVYSPVEGNLGLIYTIFISIASTISNKHHFFHHHSFSYIDKYSLLMKLLAMISSKNSTHIFLCECHSEKFSSKYNVSKKAVISNAAFVPSTGNNLRTNLDEEPIKLGLLSNLNREKGLYVFIELLQACHTQGIPVVGKLAGPVSSQEDRDHLNKSLANLGPKLSYLGPVHGATKDQFFENIDAFIFPTTYPNEAQPTVIFEALSTGLPIIAYDRGCISEQVKGNGLSIPQSENFIYQTLKELHRMKNLSEFHSEFRLKRRDRYSKLHTESLTQAKKVFQGTL